MFKVIALPRLSNRSPQDSAHARALLDADSRACADMLPRPGLPRTDREWTALVKIASGEVDIPDSQFARLVALGLVDRKSGFPELTRHGRITLGLPE